MSISNLMTSRKFLPFFTLQFMAALNDSLFKNAIAIFIVYSVSTKAGMDPQLMVSLAAGLFIAPFFLFSATAGKIADRFPKHRMIRVTRGIELAVTGFGAWSLLNGDPWIMLGALTLFGVQAAVLGPVKYSILPELLTDRDLVSGNGLIEGGTFLAILAGTIAGGLLILHHEGPMIVSVIMGIVALIGFGASFLIPATHPGNAELKIGLNPVSDTWAAMKFIRKDRRLFLSVLGISWFWLVGATFLAQFPAFTSDVLTSDETVVTLLLTVFSVGIGLGSITCSRLLKGEISARFVPAAAIGMSIFSATLWIAARSMPQVADHVRSVSEFLMLVEGWAVLASLALIAFCGGLYIVPLYAIMQHDSEESERSRVIAANNIVNALFMVISAVGATAILAAGYDVMTVFLVQAVANVVAAGVVCKLLPDASLKFLFQLILKSAYRVDVTGLENLTAAGRKSVIVVNHVSFLDAALMAAFLPGRPTFAINTQIAKRWWIQPLLKIVDAYPIDPTKPMSMKHLINAVKEGRTCVIFPEGRITVTGGLMKVFDGPGMIADKADAPIIPIRVDGAQFTPFSRLKGKVRLRWFPKITIAIRPGRKLVVDESLRGKWRRQKIGDQLYEIMSDMIFETTDRQKTLYQAILDARTIHGGKATIIEEKRLVQDKSGAEEIVDSEISYDRLILGSLALGKVLARKAGDSKFVGVLLPNTGGTAVTFFALHRYGLTPAMLNFTAGAANLKSAIEAAGIRLVVTSRVFVEKAKLETVMTAVGSVASVEYLEDIAAGIGVFAKLRALFLSMLVTRGRVAAPGKPQDPAVVLFTSGSEGTPKGVVLSHENILANCAQLAARIAFNPTDKVFNALPVFHSFGLTGGLILPVLNGIPVFLYASPLHYRLIPHLFYDTNSTVMFGTDTFLAGYARTADPYDFYNAKYVFAGAERVKDETRRIWQEKFGVRILEGYGATETAPVIATNTPMHYKSGTVGRLMPGMKYQLDPIPGIEQGGNLKVAGPNIMLGYLKADLPCIIQPVADGWYDTGDIVSVDESGFVKIMGRLKRFAKIAGEMISLTKVEAEIAALWGTDQHAVVALPDAKKGEQIVLLTTMADARRDIVQQRFKEAGLSELMLPRQVMIVAKIPVLGTGKTDYVAARKLAEEIDAQGKVA